MDMDQFFFPRWNGLVRDITGICGVSIYVITDDQRMGNNAWSKILKISNAPSRNNIYKVLLFFFCKFQNVCICALFSMIVNAPSQNKIDLTFLQISRLLTKNTPLPICGWFYFLVHVWEFYIVYVSVYFIFYLGFAWVAGMAETETAKTECWKAIFLSIYQTSFFKPFSTSECVIAAGVGPVKALIWENCLRGFHGLLPVWCQIFQYRSRSFANMVTDTSWIDAADGWLGAKTWYSILFFVHGRELVKSGAKIPKGGIWLSPL